MPKVVHLQIATESTGRIPLRLHKAFLKSGIDSSIITLRSSINDDEKIKQRGWVPKVLAWFDHLTQTFLNRHNKKEYGNFSFPVFGSNVSKMTDVQNADFIYVHWVLGGFFNFKSFKQVAMLGKPVIFFMHDMWNITGGCHHSFACEKYTEQCYNCQILSSENKKDRSYIEFKKKLKLYNRFNNLYFISPSRWLYDCARKSKLTQSKPIYYIPNLIDHSFFKPFNKNIAKKILNIELTDKVIAFGSVSINSPYKGWSYLKEALNILEKDKEFNTNITVLIFGSSHSKNITYSVPFKIRFMGFLRDEYSTLLAYNAADVFIAPSLADNLPTTVLESLSCGTPVVGFDVGGIPDMICHKVNGYLAKYKDAFDLYTGIKFCLNYKINGFSLPEFNEELIIEKHKELHRKLSNYSRLNTPNEESVI